MKNGSMPSTHAGRSTTRPIAPLRPSDSARAALLGCQPIRAAISRILALVCSDTPVLPLSA